MRTDFIGFERAYAETSTREVLLNLARLKNHETTYFFKLGQISSSYRMQATLTGSGNYAIPNVGIGGNATGGGTPGLTFENDPSFTFIPVNDDTSAQLLLKPIPAETLYNLYQQGWRVDQLFRLMVDRIEVSIPLPVADPNAKAAAGTPAKTICVVKTIRNSPPVGSATDKAYLQDASSYAAFLRVSALIYALQRSGYLKMRGTSHFVPIDRDSFIPQQGGADVSKKAPAAVSKTAAAAPGEAGTAPSAATASGGASADSAATPKASDFATAVAKGQSWQYSPDARKWMLMQQIQDAEFYLTAPKEEIMANDVFLNAPEWAQLMNSETPEIAFPILANGFSINDIPSLSDDKSQNTQDSDQTCGKAHPVMRSLVGIMAAAAQEEDAFQPLTTETAKLPLIVPAKALGLFIPKERLANMHEASFAASVPKIEKLPLLRLKWKSGDWAGPDIAEINYRGSIYRVADSNPEIDPTLSPENAHWNHDMFRLINQLIAQLTVDISKFPLPGILQLHTN
jgi:hypothetical protein